MDKKQPQDTGPRLKSTGNKALGNCPGCTREVLERETHFRTTTGNVWHGKCAEGTLDVSGVLIRIINIYATATLGSLEYMTAGRIAKALSGLSSATSAVNQLMQQYGIAKRFPSPVRPILGVVGKGFRFDENTGKAIPDEEDDPA